MEKMNGYIIINWRTNMEKMNGYILVKAQLVVEKTTSLIEMLEQTKQKKEEEYITHETIRRNQIKRDIKPGFWNTLLGRSLPRYVPLSEDDVRKQLERENAKQNSFSLLPEYTHWGRYPYTRFDGLRRQLYFLKFSAEQSINQCGNDKEIFLGLEEWNSINSIPKE